MTTPPDSVLLQKVSDEIKVKIDGFIKEIEAEYAGIFSIKFTYEIGDASVILKEKVENKTYTMVMIQGHTEQDTWLNDSVNMSVVENVPCPVYIIPPNSKYQPLNKVVYATDYKEEDLTTLKSLLNLAKPLDPEIIALHISNDDKFERKLKCVGFNKMLSEKKGFNMVSFKMIAD
jgi:hypothetical protein